MINTLSEQFNILSVFRWTYGILCGSVCAAKGGADMARMTVEEIYSGEKYDIAGKAGLDYFLRGRPITCDELTWSILLTVKYTLEIAEQFFREGDSISTMVEDELSSPFVRWDEDDDN